MQRSEIVGSAALRPQERPLNKATGALYSADMGVEMDLIRQRAANDSGHGSTMGASAIHMPMQTTDGTAIDNPQQGDIGSTEMSNNQLPRIPEDGSVAIRSAHTTVSNDFGTMDGLSSPRTAGDSAIMSLGQNVASSSSIMSFSAGSRPDAVPQEVDDSDTSLCIVRNLIGSSVTAGSKLVSMDGSLGIFFVFPDLSIRKDGDYRLRFSFFNLQSDNGELMSTVTQIKAHTFSEPFRVYSAKQFPGMIESTMMSKHFAKQGVKIPVRKESGRAGDFDS
ncbi:hypothetical protein IW145_000356 [Coemansia sp. RSA 521]|nr:hypothetical protein IW145_000356 [Coemansia sp. RSA 521]